MLREEIKNINAAPRQLRQFGMMIGVILLAIAGLLLWKQRGGYFACASVGIGFIVAALALPAALKPVFKAWMAFAVVMGFIMTRVILTVFFFGVFTPMALAIKLFGKDLLSERWNKAAATYWVKRPREPFDPRTAENMF